MSGCVCVNTAAHDQQKANVQHEPADLAHMQYFAIYCSVNTLISSISQSGGHLEIES